MYLNVTLISYCGQLKNKWQLRSLNIAINIMLTAYQIFELKQLTRCYIFTQICILVYQNNFVIKPKCECSLKVIIINKQTSNSFHFSLVAILVSPVALRETRMKWTAKSETNLLLSPHTIKGKQEKDALAHECCERKMKGQFSSIQFFIKLLNILKF